VAFPATITAQGGNVYEMRLTGTDSGASYSYFYWAGSTYRANILYSRMTSAEYVIFTVHEAPVSVSGNTIGASAAGQYQYVGSTLVDCRGTFTITITR
jgi:hypothetical protein